MNQIHKHPHPHKRSFLQLSALALLAPAALLASAQQAPAATTTVEAEAVVRHHAVLVEAVYADTLAAAKDLQSAIAAFVAAPSAEALDKARQAWRAAREFYGQTEAFRFYGGPIDDARGPEGRLNAWPLDEAYVDAVAGKPKAGLINNPKFRISKASLSQANERGGEENISAGWHAIEFLLWGQDRSETGPGERSPDDFIDGRAPNADRRRQYLAVVTELLIDDLSFLANAWAPGARNYRAKFEQGGRESVRKMIVGLGSLSRGELAGERLEVALNSQDQEDEHSCFSDNTHRDAVTNALGIQNVWLGQYTRRDGSLLQGPGLRDLVAAKKPDLAERTTAQIAASVAAAEAIQAPFDREIAGAKDAPGRLRVRKTIDSLVAQSKLLVDAAAAVGIAKLTLVQP
ncbi:putative iron-regulated protein [Sphaerotilus natans subsp. natans DSM 6575]|uniref:Putative iron-regulated protein n=1 Tax=Sphaerotilus natans subsp. natans DSM 6575 TaxID=1286631 RepID=A0A059KPY0_9BURK|nr:imelysin family protein [Sphaerotilus natans]KDB53491.1 putative iron-regulated protein [Sphaerotilus natans subsp. natans DSM 6575]SIQ86495.1 putative iron-regulated protein [Sphaerotilus natans]